jgi:hypothetical protein
MLNLKNISGVNLGKVTFESIFFDAKGNVIDTVEYKISDFEKDKTRTLRIETPKAGTIDVRSYCVKVTGVIKTPVPVVAGDDRISILKHGFQVSDATDDMPAIQKSNLELAIRNISEDTIATTILEVEFYDSDGNILDVVRIKS